MSKDHKWDGRLSNLNDIARLVRALGDAQEVDSRDAFTVTEITTDDGERAVLVIDLTKAALLGERALTESERLDYQALSLLRDYVDIRR